MGGGVRVKGGHPNVGGRGKNGGSPKWRGWRKWGRNSEMGGMGEKGRPQKWGEYTKGGGTRSGGVGEKGGTQEMGGMQKSRGSLEVGGWGKGGFPKNGGDGKKRGTWRGGQEIVWGGDLGGWEEREVPKWSLPPQINSTVTLPGLPPPVSSSDDVKPPLGLRPVPCHPHGATGKRLCAICGDRSSGTGQGTWGHGGDMRTQGGHGCLPSAGTGPRVWDIGTRRETLGSGCASSVGTDSPVGYMEGTQGGHGDMGVT